VRENCTPGSVRGPLGNWRSYRDEPPIISRQDALGRAAQRPTWRSGAGREQSIMGDNPHKRSLRPLLALTVSCNVLDVVVVPLWLQLPESHRLRLAQGTLGFE
jgi:hypothetical protein